MGTTKVIPVLLSVLLAGVIVACNSEPSTGGGGANAPQGEAAFLKYDEDSGMFKGSVTWVASNVTEQALVGFVEGMYFRLYTADKVCRWEKSVDTSIDTAALSVTGFLFSDDYDVIKWADIPGTTLKAELTFTTGSTIVVKSQAGYKGADMSGRTLTLDDGILIKAYMSRSREQGMLLVDCANIREGDGSVEAPSIKVAAVTLQAYGATYRATVDWTDSMRLVAYENKIGRGNTSYWKYVVAPFTPCVNFSDGTVYTYGGAFSGFTHSAREDAYYPQVSGGTTDTTAIADAEQPVVITVTSTAGNTYTITTNGSELCALAECTLSGYWLWE